MKNPPKKQKKCHFCGKSNKTVKPRRFGHLTFKIYCCDKCDN